MRERIRFESESASLSLAEYDQRQIDSDVDEYVVGERVELNADKIGLGTMPIENIRWSVPGRTVYFYSGDATRTVLVNLDKKYFMNRSITFYWVDAADNRQIVCNAVVRKGRERIPVTVSKIVNVKGPKLVGFTAEVSKPMIIAGRGGTRRISFGDRNAKPGIVYSSTIDMPAGFSGSIKDVQLVKLGRKKKRLLAPGGTASLQKVKGKEFPNKDYLLDIGTAGDEACKPDRAADEPNYSATVKADAGKTIIFDLATDSPSDELAPLDISYSVDESFKYFILFKPNKPNSIWVPLGIVEWFWKAEARRERAAWRIVNGSGRTKDGKGKGTNEFPEYRGNACDIPWNDLK